MSGLTLKSVSKSYNGVPVLHEVSLELSEGELLVLLGPSGCGKSTILRIVAGLEDADSGEVLIDNKRVDGLPPRERNVGLVFQNYSLYPHMSVGKNLAFPLKVAGLKKAQVATRVHEIARLLDLEGRLEDRPGQLSGGQRQRVALGRAIVGQPSVFLLDEPLSNLDAELRVRMRHEIVRLQKKLGRTMIHVTHDQAEALSMADRIALLHQGQIVQIGTPEELYKRPTCRKVAAFIGHPQINLIPGEAHDGRLSPFGVELPKKLIDADVAELVIGLRPEAIRISNDGPFQATIDSCEYVGDSYVLGLSFDSHTLTVANSVRSLSAGTLVRFAFDLSTLLFFDANNGRNLML